MKKIVLCMLMVLTMIIATGCGGNSDGEGSAPEKITIGTQSFVHDQTLAIAEDYFKETIGEDIEIEVVVFSSGKDAVNALISGDVDFIHSGSIPTVSGIANDMGGEVIWIHNVLNNADAVAAREGSGIETLADLKGKKVGTPFVSTTHYVLETGLKHSGVDPSTDVEILDMQPDEIYAAWMRGDIDAASVWDPTLSTLEGGEIIYSAGDAAAAGDLTVDLGIVRTEFAEQYPDIVVKYVQALEKAEQFHLSDKAAAVSAIAEHLELSEADAESQMDASIWLSAEEQLAEEYFGGELAEALYNMAIYLYESENIVEEPQLEDYQNAINATYIEKALETE